MRYHIDVEIDLITELENRTTLGIDFNFRAWVRSDTDRLRKIVEFLEQQEKELQCKSSSPPASFCPF